MILDAQSQFSSSQALTGSAVGENVISLGVARSIGQGEPMVVLFCVEVAADQTTGDEDYTFDVEYATNAGQSTGRQLIGRRVFESGTPTAPAQDADLLVAGYKFTIPVPAVTQSEDEIYLGIRSTLAGSTPAITISAWLVPQSMATVGVMNYANGYTIA